MEGLLLVDKPAGWTSFDVVNYVRRIVAGVEGKKPKNVKVGHTGTLDPAATGLLVLLVGKNYTRRAGELTKATKTYQVEMTLGQVSTTADSEGEITQQNDVKPEEAAVRTAIEKFTGDLMQVPPIFSAIKIDGRRAYDMARKGQDVTLEPRPVTIYRSEFAAYEYPVVRFASQVSSGTYIRSLVVDLGEELGTGAYMSALRRTHVAQYAIEDSVTPDVLTPELLAERLLKLPDVTSDSVAR